MKKKYSMPKVINVAEKINGALVHGVLVFIARSLKIANTGLTGSNPDATSPKTLQARCYSNV